MAKKIIDYFIVSEEKGTEKSNNVIENSKTETKFPSTDIKFPSNGTSFADIKSTVNDNPFLEKILDVYEKGFNKLNQPGYDFFEYFKSVVKGGIDNPKIYEMALEMGRAMDSNVSKDSLLNQADYYISELSKVHSGFKNDGQSKINELTSKKNEETTSLVSDINSLTQQLESIQRQIESKKTSLAQIDNKYQPSISEITLKLSANDMAKDRYISDINKVKSNILNNLK
jgi:hypothetical protein